MYKHHTSSKESSHFSVGPRFAPMSGDVYPMNKTERPLYTLPVPSLSSSQTSPMPQIPSRAPLSNPYHLTRNFHLPINSPIGRDEKHFSMTPSSTHSMHYDSEPQASPSILEFAQPPYRFNKPVENPKIPEDFDSDVISSIEFKRVTMSPQRYDFTPTQRSEEGHSSLGAPKMGITRTSR